MFNIKEFATHDEYVAYTANTGDFITPNVSYCRKKRECHFTSKQPQRDYSHDYLTFVALEGGTFKFSGNSINYSLDSGQTWVSLASNTNTPAVSAGNTIMWRTSGITPSSSYGIGRFSSSAKFAVQGNAMSIVSGDSFDSASTISDYQFYHLFDGCTGLVGAKNLYLPSMTLASSCYKYMFCDCTSLISTPTLPATTLANNCYANMFQRCTSLTTAPVLPATMLADYCYDYMFQGCTSLTIAPELPATTLTLSCYHIMFHHCTSLTSAPELPATTLASNCYQSMFADCTSLTTAPDLPATTLAIYCYQSMFSGCTSLTTAPDLPATTLVQSCYSNMFRYCSKLNYIKAMFTTAPSSTYTSYWVQGVASTGTFVKNAAAIWTGSGNNSVPYGWYVEREKAPIVPTTSFTTNNYITLESQQVDSIINITNSSNQTFYISEDHQNWEEITGGFAYLLSEGETIYICGVLNGDNTSSDYSNIAIKGKVALTGSCNSLWNYENPSAALKAGCGCGLFSGSTGLLNAPELPATTLADGCYANMFYGCTSLTTIPELPATTLATACYGNMFAGCTSLTIAPALPATTLASNCYRHMFADCVKLTTAPSALPATTLASMCYMEMFYNCTSLTTAPALPATTLASRCYENMFGSCTSLRTAPELTATTLAERCYYQMFWDCIGLTTAPSSLPATNISGCNYCYSSMFSNCTSLTAAPQICATTMADSACTYMFQECRSLTTAPSILPATTLADSCYYSMFNGCTGLTTAPTICATTMADSACTYMFQECRSLTTAPSILPATTLADSCYQYMFQECSSLTTVPDLPATTLASRCYYDMFTGCRSLTTAPALPATTLADSCYYEIFSRCTSLTTAPALPATTLANYCYYGMFDGCTSLATAPELSATTLAGSCYSNMFKSCTSLTTAPELPATTLADGCYGHMFNSCRSLTTAPELPATTLVSGCYAYMFYGCSNLNYIKAMFTTTPSTTYTYNWVNGVTSTGTFVKSPSATWTTTGVNGIPDGWTIEYEETPIVPTTSFTTTNYVTFESKEDGSKITINPSSYQTFYISNNHKDWAVFDSVFFNHLSNGDKLYVCGTLAGQNTSNDYTNFAVIGKVSSSGECSSLWNYEDPSNSLKTACGYGMFSGSTGLLSAPNIPQSISGGGGDSPSYTIATAPGASYGFSANSSNFYESKNKGVHNSAAVTRVTFMLPYAVIVSISYINNGESCCDYGLIGKPDVALSTSNTSDSNVMLNLAGKSSTSVNTFSFELESGTHFVDFKFRKDSSVSSGNDSLQFKIDSMVEPLFAMSACTYMFAGCTSLTTPPQLPATALAETCYSYMFQGCTSLTTAPELPAETLVGGCYNYMFDGCSSLNYIKAMFTTTPSTTYTNTWVNGVSSTGTFVKNPSATWTTTGVNGVPDGWTIQTASN